LDDYKTLNATYYELLANFEFLNTTYQNLNSTYYELQRNYDSLQIGYNDLLAQYDSLNSTYNNLLQKTNELETKYDTTLCMHADVERRGVKIGKFEEKYGVKIRPRNTLEDALRSMELKEERKVKH